MTESTRATLTADQMDAVRRNWGVRSYYHIAADQFPAVVGYLNGMGRKAVCPFNPQPPLVEPTAPAPALDAPAAPSDAALSELRIVRRNDLLRIESPERIENDSDRLHALRLQLECQKIANQLCALLGKLEKLTGFTAL